MIGIKIVCEKKKRIKQPDLQEMCLISAPKIGRGKP
jgi:hypothetical protein